MNSLVGEYRLVDFLGAGGMGEVYRAVHTKIGRVAAVKFLTNAAADPSLTERFFNEARIQANLHHPAIATLYDFLEFDGRPCIIMEYVDGQTLADRIRSGPLPLAEALSFFRTVVQAVAHIHAHGVIHRDIKPGNVKVSGAGQVKLLDFGIARSDSAPRVTVTGGVIGTLEYLSPEQLRGAAADRRSDVWALGVLFYEMLTGCPPFESTNVADLCERIGKAAYEPVTRLNPAVSRDAERVIERCLKKNPSDRYQSAQDLLVDLTSRTAEAKPDKPSQPARMIIPAAAAIVLIVILALYAVIQTTVPDPAPQANSNDQQTDLQRNAIRSVRIDTSEGPAKVVMNGRDMGMTPFVLKGRPGERLSLTLKRDGFEDKAVELTIGENPRPFTFTLNKIDK